MSAADRARKALESAQASTSAAVRQAYLGVLRSLLVDARELEALDTEIRALEEDLGRPTGSGGIR